MPAGRVRRLERALLLERAEAIARKVVRQYLEDWDPDDRGYPLDLAIRLRQAGVTLPNQSQSQARLYLENCQRSKTVPDPKPILYALLPWTVRR